MYYYIKTSIENNIGIIILNEPQKKNALSQPMARELLEILKIYRFHPSVNVILIRGADGCFCAGGDIHSMKKRIDCYAQNISPETETKLSMERLNQVILSIRQIEKPVISWIEGSCAGGGMSLAMACDFSISSEDTKMTFAFVNVGLAPDMGSSLMLTRRVGSVRATDLFITGRIFTGREAADLSIITQAVPAEELEMTVMMQAKRLAVGPSCSYREVKAVINRILYADLFQCMSMEADCADRLTHTSDHAEAVNAFLEKRKPKFIGK